MSKPPLELIPAPEPDGPPRTASGLDESQIAAEDLRALQALVQLRHLDLSAACQVQFLALASPALQLGAVPCRLEIPHVLKLKFAALPDKPHLRPIKIPPCRVQLQRGLQPVYGVPVRRRRMLAGELSREREQALYRRLYEKYGEAARELEVLAVFAHIPVEAAASLAVSGDLREVEFRLPAKPRPDQLQGGAYLLVLKDAQGKLRKLIMRLENHA